MNAVRKWKSIEAFHQLRQSVNNGLLMPSSFINYQLRQSVTYRSNNNGCSIYTCVAFIMDQPNKLKIKLIVSWYIHISDINLLPRIRDHVLILCYLVLFNRNKHQVYEIVWNMASSFPSANFTANINFDITTKCPSAYVCILNTCSFNLWSILW